MWMKLLSLLLIVVLVWWLWNTYRNNPRFFSRSNWSKSFFTMGILALVLIGVVALCIMFLKTKV